MKLVSAMSVLATAAAAVSMVAAASDDGRGLVADGVSSSGLPLRGLKKKHSKKSKKAPKSHGKKNKKASKSKSTSSLSSKAAVTAKRLHFIQNLTLPPMPLHGLKGSKGGTGYDGKAQGAFDDGSVMTFVGDITGQARNDVLNSVLLAQLAANHAYDRESDTENWYHKYSEVLENTGWTVPQFEFTEYQASGTEFSMDEALLQLIDNLAGAEDAKKEALKEVVAAVKALENEDGNVELFTDRTTHDGQGNFQVGVASERDGVVNMDIGAIRFDTTQHVTGVLWFTFSTAETKFYDGSEKLVLNDEVYGQVRNAVVDKLGDNAKTYISNIEI